MTITIRWFILATGLLLSSAPFLAAQIDAAATDESEQSQSEASFAFGGTSTSTIEYQLLTPVFPAGRSFLAPKMTIQSAVAEMTLSAGVTVDSLQGISIDCDELRLRLQLGDFGVLSAGRFAYLPGTALFFSNVEYFSTQDVSRILSQGLSAVGSPDDMVQLKVFGDSWHITGTMSPFRPSAVPFPTNSTWFPLKGITQSFDVLGTTYTLRNLTWDEDTSSPPLVEDVGLSIEGGVFFGPLDLSLSWFRGPDRSPAITAFITMPTTPWGVYDITLHEEQSQIQREGMAGSLQVGPCKAWVDTSLFQGKLLASGDLYSAIDGWRTGSQPMDGLNLTCGLSWNLPWASATLSVEWKDAWYFGDTTGLTFPLLDRAVVVLATGSLFNDKLSISLAGVVSLADNSFVLLPGATIDLGGDISLTVACPYFFGDLDTRLGQFRSVGRGILTFSIGF